MTRRQNQWSKLLILAFNEPSLDNNQWNDLTFIAVIHTNWGSSVIQLLFHLFRALKTLHLHSIAAQSLKHQEPIPNSTSSQRHQMGKEQKHQGCQVLFLTVSRGRVLATCPRLLVSSDHIIPTSVPSVQQNLHRQTGSYQPCHEKTCLRGFRPGNSNRPAQPQKLARGL